MDTCTILNYEKFNPRSDVKRPSWYRKENNIYFDEKFFDYTAHELLVWDFLLSSASRNHDATFRYNEAYISQYSRVPIDEVRTAVQKLERDGAVRVDREPRNVNVPPTNARVPKRIATEITENTEITNSTKNTDARSLRESPPGNPVVGKYIDEFRKKYSGTTPGLAGKDFKLLKQIGEIEGPEVASDMVTVFFQMPEDWFKTKCHDVGTFWENRNKVKAALHTGRADPARKSVLEELEEMGLGSDQGTVCETN